MTRRAQFGSGSAKNPSSVTGKPVQTASDPVTDLSTDGIWTWHGNPRAVSGDGKTFVGHVKSNGDIEAASIDHETRATTTTVLSSGVDDDDHASPGLAIDNSGYVWYFYAAHDGPEILYRQSSSPYDISSFDSEQSVSPVSEHEYANPRVDDDGRLWLIFQNGSQEWMQMYSDDGGSTWSTATTWLSDTGGGTYVQMDDGVGGPWDFAAYRVTASGREDIYHGQFDSGTIRDSSGTSLGSSTDITNLTQVYDSGASGNYQAQAFDCARVDGTLQITFGLYPQKWENHQYWYATYSGGSWSIERMVNGGANIGRARGGNWNYSGLAHLDRTESGSVFASIGDNNSSKVVRLQTPDDGETWFADDFASGAGQNVRPVSPQNAGETLPCVWLQGHFNYYNFGFWNLSVVAGRDTSDGGAAGRGALVYAQAKLTSNQSVSSAVTTDLNLDTSTIDIRDSLDAANDQFVVGPGLYKINATITFAGNSGVSEGRAIALLNTSQGRKDADYSVIRPDEETSLKLDATVWLTDNETISAEVRQEGGTAVDVDATLEKTHVEVTQLR